MTALDLIKQGWCQDQFHKVINGKDYFCSFGAILRTYGPSKTAIHKNLCIFREVVGTHDISLWNDDPARTHEEVIEAFEKARV